MIDTAKTPDELKVIPQWVLWRWEERINPRTGEVKLTKPPYQPNGQHAESDNSNTWSTFETVVHAYQKGEFAGIGFVVTNEVGIVGVDLDHCRDAETGAIQPWAYSIVNTLNSYTEITPSREGLRVFIYGKLPPKDRKIGNFECYESGRFLTITGEHLTGTPTTIKHRQEEIDQVHAQMFAERNKRRDNGQIPSPSHLPNLDDQEVLEKAFNAKNGEKVWRLYHGDRTGYNSDSEADFALFSLLAFYTGPDTEKLERLARASDLCRPRWDEPRGSTTWGAMSIAKVLEGRTEFYNPQFHADSHGNGNVPPSSNGDKTTDAGGRPHSTDQGNAQRLVALHGRDLKYSFTRKCWYVWDGNYWALDTTGEIFRRGKTAVAAIYDEAARALDDEERKRIGKWAIASESNQKLDAMITMARSELGIPVKPQEMDQDPWLLNCPNGTLNLRTGELQKHRREDLITQVTAAEYAPTARYGLFDEFLDRILPDPAQREFVQRALGYSITGFASEEKLFFAFGPTATGKSTLLKAVGAALGNYSTVTNFETFLERKNETDKQRALAPLVSKRFVVSVEVNEGERLAESVINTITGGDGATARFLYQEAFSFDPKFTLWLAANNRPRVRDDNDANWRRIVQIPFNEQIPEDERDPNVKASLSDPDIAGPAILAWLVQGCLDWQEKGLNIPDSVKQTTREYRNEMNPLGDFLEERCVLIPEARVTNPELRSAYLEWARKNEITRPLGPKQFSQRLNAMDGVREGKSGSTRYWVGIGLLGGQDLL
jgi:putative DNA primase/helicase